MVGLGLLMIALAVVGLWLRMRGRLYVSRPFLRFACVMGPAGLVSILAGWITTEVGRQPWVVYGVFRTVDAVSPHSVGQMVFTLALFVLVYFVVFGTGTVYLLRIIGAGPTAGEGDHPVSGGPGEHRQPMRPLSGAPESLPVG